MLYFKPKKTHAGIKFILQFNTDSAKIATTDQNGKELNFNGKPYVLYNYEMKNVGEQINTDPGTKYNYTIDMGVDFILSASDALNKKLNEFAHMGDVVSVEFVQKENKSWWEVEPMDSREEPKIDTCEEKGVDWDEIAAGKVRHGFAIEAFRKGMILDKKTEEEINNWVMFVMSGTISADITVSDDDSMDLSF